MKIKDSKYYREIQIFGVNYEDHLQLYDRHKTLAFNSPYEELLDDLMSRINLRGSDLVINKDKLSEFQQCTDFYTVSYSNANNKLYENEACYFHPELELFIITSHNLSNEYEEQIFEEGLAKVIWVYYQNTNPKAKANLQQMFDQYLEKYISKESKVSILFKTKMGFEFATHSIKPYKIDLYTMYNDDFMPVHKKVKESITNDNKGIVLFHGIAGSGKTNYIKWLTGQVPNKKFIFVPTSMISSLTDPSFIGLLVENKNSVLVLEDCENYIAERNTMNMNTDVVSSILNIADGILSDILECQLICTFNSDISKIDSALLRKGRLIAEYKFKELTVEKSNIYLKSVGKEPNATTTQSLAELTNSEQLIKETNPSPNIGFR